MFWGCQPLSVYAAPAATRPRRRRRDVSNTPDSPALPYRCVCRHSSHAQLTRTGGISGLWRHNTLLQWTGEQPPTPEVSLQGHCQDPPYFSLAPSVWHFIIFRWEWSRERGGRSGRSGRQEGWGGNVSGCLFGWPCFTLAAATDTEAITHGAGTSRMYS